MADEPSPSDWDRWEAALERGDEPSTAAKALGLTCTKFRRANTQRHAEALTLSREARGHFVDEKMEEWVVADDASPFTRNLWAKRHNIAYRERSEVALTGADGGVLEVAIVDDEQRATALARKLVALGVVPAGGGDEAEPAGVDPAPAA